MKIFLLSCSKTHHEDTIIKTVWYCSMNRQLNKPKYNGQKQIYINTHTHTYYKYKLAYEIDMKRLYCSTYDTRTSTENNKFRSQAPTIKNTRYRTKSTNKSKLLYALGSLTEPHKNSDTTTPILKILFQEA